MQKITPCLWFDFQAEEAAQFYVSLFKNSKLGHVLRYDAESAKVSGQPEGSVLTVEFEINGQAFTAMNGGPLFKFSEAVSFMIDCEDQAEVDYYWNAFTKEGQESQCGWLKDKFGLSWQIVPKQLTELMSGSDPVKMQKVMHAMLQMKKLDIATLQAAYDA